MRLLVCGSREWGDGRRIESEIDFINPLVVIHGACSRHRGDVQVSADMLADFAARGLGHHVIPFPVDHSIDGPWPMAGPRRNARMLRDGKPTRGLAFGALYRKRSDGRGWKYTGTGGMVHRMIYARLPVRWVASPGAEAVDLVTMPDPPK